MGIASRPRMLAGIALVALAGTPAGAQTEWKSGVSGNWHDNTKWKGNVVPNNAATSVLINAAGQNFYSVSLNNDAIVKSLQFETSDGILSIPSVLTIDNGLFSLVKGKVEFLGGGKVKRGANAAAFNFSDGEIVSGGGINDIEGMNLNMGKGKLTVDGFGLPQSLFQIDGNLTNSKGTVLLDNTAPPQPNVEPLVGLHVAGTFLNDKDATFSLQNALPLPVGRRQFSGSLLNKGKVQVGDLNQLPGFPPTAASFVATANNQSYINDGQFNVHAAFLTIDGAGNMPTFNQRNGTLEIIGGFFGNKIKFQYDGGVIAGGWVNLTRSKLGFNPAPNSLDTAGFLITGGVKGQNDTPADTYTELTSNVPAKQDILVSGSKKEPWAGLRKEGINQTLVNKGSIRLKADEGAKAADDVILAVGSADGTLQNDGLLEISSGAATKLDGGKRYVNGTLKNHANVNIRTDVQFTGGGLTHTNAGVWGMIGGKKPTDPDFVTVTMPVSSTIQNTGTGVPRATVEGNGKFKVFRFENAGTLRPGKTPSLLPETGLLEIEGDDGDPNGATYIQHAGGVLETLIGGYTAVDEFDLLRIDGTAVLEPGAYAGLTLHPGFYPNLGDTFDILTATDGISGTMGLGSNPSWNGLSFELHTVQSYDFETHAPVWAVRAVVVPGPGVGVAAVLTTAGFVVRRRR